MRLIQKLRRPVSGRLIRKKLFTVVAFGVGLWTSELELWGQDIVFNFEPEPPMYYCRSNESGAPSVSLFLGGRITNRGRNPLIVNKGSIIWHYTFRSESYELSGVWGDLRAGRAEKIEIGSWPFTRIPASSSVAYGLTGTLGNIPEAWLGRSWQLDLVADLHPFPWELSEAENAYVKGVGPSIGVFVQSLVRVAAIRGRFPQGPTTKICVTGTF